MIKVKHFFLDGVLISGAASGCLDHDGKDITTEQCNTASPDTVELYVPSTGVLCTLPSLPEAIQSHTMENSGLLCSTSYPDYTCLQWSPDTGTWKKLLNLDSHRSTSVSWTPVTGNGTYLMGGSGSYPSYDTTTLVRHDGIQEPGFPLKYHTE